MIYLKIFKKLQIQIKNIDSIKLMHPKIICPRHDSNTRHMDEESKQRVTSPLPGSHPFLYYVFRES